jgi:hypothetical protein
LSQVVSIEVKFRKLNQSVVLFVLRNSVIFAEISFKILGEIQRRQCWETRGVNVGAEIEALPDPTQTPTAAASRNGSLTRSRLRNHRAHTPNPQSPLTRILPSSAVNSIDPGSASAMQKNTFPGSECSK